MPKLGERLPFELTWREQLGIEHPPEPIANTAQQGPASPPSAAAPRNNASNTPGDHALHAASAGQ
jgi:hypothetical protein